MPRYSNRFKEQTFLERTILGHNGKVVGTSRIKPSSVMWKSRKHSFSPVRLNDFVAWITKSARAERTSR